MSDPHLKLQNTRILSAQWIPMGINNLIALNRFLGSHKGYESGTEFGIKGNFSNIKQGTFDMTQKGVMLKPGKFDFNHFVNMDMEDNEGHLGVYADSLGHVRIAAKTDPCENGYEQHILKELSGKLNRRMVQGFYPVLSETQQDMLHTLYGSDNLVQEPFRTISYSLIIAESCSIPIRDTATILKAQKDIFAPICDWLTDHFSYNSCHIFVGQSACICIGEPDESLKSYLHHLLFIKSLYQVSQRLYARISSLSKDIQQSRNAISGAQLKHLTRINKKSTQFAAYFARLDTLDKTIISAIEKQRSIYDRFCRDHAELSLLQTDFSIEIEKSSDRTVIIDHLKNELDNLNEASAQRMDEMMSQNGEFMNIVLLVMTILTIVGFGDIFGLSIKQNLIIAGIMLPFIVVAFVYIRNYFKNYSSSKKSRKKR